MNQCEHCQCPCDLADGKCTGCQMDSAMCSCPAKSDDGMGGSDMGGGESSASADDSTADAGHDDAPAAM